jgi:hypothetical protein
METAPFVQAIRTDLEELAAGDEETASVASRLARALEPSLHLRLFDVVGQAALELSGRLPAGSVDVRLSGRDVELVYVADEAAAEPAPAEDEGTARLTLRMPEGMKVRVEEAAARDGVSTNAWLVRAVSGGLSHGPTRRSGRRITGFAQT